MFRPLRAMTSSSGITSCRSSRATMPMWATMILRSPGVYSFSIGGVSMKYPSARSCASFLGLPEIGIRPPLTLFSELLDPVGNLPLFYLHNHDVMSGNSGKAEICQLRSCPSADDAGDAVDLLFVEQVDMSEEPQIHLPLRQQPDKSLFAIIKSVPAPAFGFRRDVHGHKLALSALVQHFPEKCEFLVFQRVIRVVHGHKAETEPLTVEDEI